MPAKAQKSTKRGRTTSSKKSAASKKASANAKSGLRGRLNNNSKGVPGWENSSYGIYLLLIAITILLSMSFVMAFSASSNDAVIREVQREYAAQNLVATPDGLMLEDEIGADIDDASMADTSAAATADGTQDNASAQAHTEESVGILGLLSALLRSAYAAGFRHLAFALLGVGLAYLISRKNYRDMLPAVIIAATILLITLVGLWLLGRPIAGSSRWINLGFISLQPSEFAKPTLIVLLAGYCAWARDVDDRFPRRRNEEKSLPFYQRDGFIPAALIIGCLVAIILSPDLGTTLIIGVGLTASYILTGWPWKRLAAGLALIGTGGLWFLMNFGQAYQQRRIYEFFSDASTGWQTRQAELALGSGGFFGLGPGMSRQKFSYLPEAHNDFIIAILGEELGFVGIALVLICFGLLLYGGLSIAYRAKDRLGTAIAGGATVLLVFQALLNIFAVIGLFPVTGKPLPFITLGGSSMMSTFILVGLIFSVARYGSVTPPAVRKDSIFTKLALGSGTTYTRDRDPEDRHDDYRDDQRGSRGLTASYRRANTRDDDEDEDEDDWIDLKSWRKPRNRRHDTKVDLDAGTVTEDKAEESDHSRGRSRRPRANQSDEKEKRRRAKSRTKQREKRRSEGATDDEDDLEWRWDSGSHISGSRAGK